jgi:RNA polymerase sporulation-specific sigma factor
VAFVSKVSKANDALYDSSTDNISDVSAIMAPVPRGQRTDAQIQVAERATVRALRDINDALDAAAPAPESDALPLSPDYEQVVARIRDVLTVGEIADAVGVRDRQVHHWASGSHNPQGLARERLLALHHVVSQLQLSLSREATKVWFWAPNPRLDDHRPIDALARGEAESVIAAASELSLREVPSDEALVDLAKQGNATAYEQLVRRYRGFVRGKVSNYRITQAQADDLVQEGLLGLYKAIRDYRSDAAPFQRFAELCVSRQVVAAVKTGNRARHDLEDSQYDSSAKTSDKVDETFDAALLDRVDDLRSSQIISPDELRALVFQLSSGLTEVETTVLSLYLDGHSYEAISDQLQLEPDTISQALQRTKRKVSAQLSPQGIT